MHPGRDRDPLAAAHCAFEQRPGILDGVTFIQRINTAGGIRPTTPGTTVGDEVRIPYTTEYYFYKEAN
jgi:hypothetical protein